MVVLSLNGWGVVLLLQQAAPQVNHRLLISTVAGSVAALGAAPALTDEIGYAASISPSRPTHLVGDD